LVEGFGLTYLEAQSNKIPVLASDIPVAREILGDSALFFDPTDQNDLISKLEKILRDDVVRNDLVAKSQVNLQRFVWEIAAEKTEEIYRKVLSQ
jgi:glycosyltransferase involved in cell wall biosynthesis